MEAVFKESAQRVFQQVLLPVARGGNMPVDTGFLRASFRTTLNEPTMTLTFRKGPSGSFSLAPPALTIASARLGDTIYGVFTANYARYVEYGTSRMSGRGFVRLAAQQWQRIVREVSREAQTRAGG